MNEIMLVLERKKLYMYLIEPRLYCVRVKIYINLFLKNKKQKKHRLLSHINRN